MKKAKAKKAGGAAKKDEPTPSPAAAETAPEETPTTVDTAIDDALASPTTTTPSLAQQSKARSTSFRQASGGPLSPGPLSPGVGPDGETAPDIYRKYVGRIEELEKENKRWQKEAKEAEKRWKNAEEEVAELREGEVEREGGGEKAGDEKLRNEIAALQRQNQQLQAQVSRAGGGPGRHGSSPSISVGALPAAELEAQLQSKSATIETMELEMSRLRAQVERLSVSASTPSEQIAALEEKLARAEKAAALAQRELADLKRNLERATEKAVKEGSERTSAETKLRALERENADVLAARDELAKKVEALEKKVTTLTTLHKEQDARTQALRKEKERADKDIAELREKVERVEAENLRLRKKDAAEGGGDDEGVDELENEERLRMEKRLRELEAENSDLRRGIWHERRKEMQVGPDDVAPGGRFENVDLGISPAQRGAAGGLGGFISSGLSALTGAATGAEHDGLLEDDDMEFDEDAFRRAQEEDQKKRIERIKDIKRTLKNWEGWRLDLVENRRGGGEGIGEIFEI
ncbi:hypothetical protein B0T14DRAFT_436263 [Immersiella caudata]|uniref:M protein repeat protein n=1 Tax=Immersiella caudata TaxID=314043 RepID=A0AA39WDG4_9PEZI|nr:hypothetical protein B0T14DRAFT_436263 [Immersiella caudata]